jgi:2-keto-4-pentenoate hydratase/2-oxohepta-3-ene-1,7-dioic acid hydratase in catechol pathway
MLLAPGRDGPLTGEVLTDSVVAFTDRGRVVDIVAGGASGAVDGEAWRLLGVTVLAFISDLGTICAVGLHYAAHVAGTGVRRPEAPIGLVKVRGSVAPLGGPVCCPEV